MDGSLRYRVAALCLLFVGLGALLVAHGAVEPDPDRHHYPDNDHVVAEYDEHVGSGVVVSGTVVSTDPAALRIESGRGGRTTLTLSGVEGVESGDNVWLYGVARPDRTVAVETAVVRDHWEIWYMFAVSALGGVVVLGRFVDGWRFERSEWAFVPRDVALRERLRSDDGASETAASTRRVSSAGTEGE